ncbi:PaaI family thioesterase [Desulfopila sp. IMCC35006]|uniref:PaaI family thioesterase n=1 Tax=Desulfopila sp. IMCC35006 TaxID=2569542 RepID=UPI0010ACB885|nr:PaaI family thioesterase [Desulfopila sp. IMCC35006]TKB26272.1 PaaI family thioesterase [Desulfopila sp. IMCC35006]
MRVRVTRKQPNSKMCFVCGMSNRFGLKSRFYELEDGQLMAVFQPAEEHQGYPGRLHGGIAATILDETIGRAIMVAHSGNIWGVTIDFSMKLRKPVPIDGEIRVLARIVSEGKRSFQGEGEILLADGQTAVAGSGKYLKMDIEKIADFDHQGEDWFVVNAPDDPECVELSNKG